MDFSFFVEIKDAQSFKSFLALHSPGSVLNDRMFGQDYAMEIEILLAKCGVCRY